MGVSALGCVTPGGTRELIGVPPGPSTIVSPPIETVVVVVGTGTIVVLPATMKVALAAVAAGCGLGSVRSAEKELRDQFGEKPTPRYNVVRPRG